MITLAKCIRPYISNEGAVYGCGTCPSCRRQKRREWAVRTIHESLYQKHTLFITLTYNTRHMKINPGTKPMVKGDQCGTLCKQDITKFFKRLRKHYNQYKLRYIQSGEYGDEYKRPHHHVILWGLPLHEIEKPESRKKNTIAKIWGLGRVDIDLKPVTINAIDYVLGYTRKKINGHDKKDYIANDRIPPYSTASKGIGREWCVKHINNLIETQSVGYRNTQISIPRYYIKTLHNIEGQKTKTKIIHQDKDTRETTESTEYKTIINVEGEKYIKFTKKYYQNMLEKHKKNYKDYGKILTEKQIEAINIKEKLRFWKLQERRCEDWSKWKNNEIKKSIHRWTKKPKEYKDAEKLERKAKLLEIEVEQVIKLEKSAKQRDLEIQKGIYGKRNKMELMQDFEENKEKALDKIYKSVL